MASNASQYLYEIIEASADRILTAWVGQLEKNTPGRSTQGREAEIRDQSREFFSVLQSALATSTQDNTGAIQISGNNWQPVREFLEELSKVRARQGYAPIETAMFVFSLKDPVFSAIQDANGKGDLIGTTMAASRLLDALGLYTTDAYQRSREDIISRQQQELMELSTPVVKLWDEILALPLIGTLDSARTQVVMENLLQEIVATGAAIAIIDITGVPTVDTLVAQHLLKTVAAARLMGADCIISGFRPQIAQNIVHLGVELNDVITKATLADAFALALIRTGQSIKRGSSKQAAQRTAESFYRSSDSK
jgi:rsbT co-antagonist protein RsbR